MKKSSPCAARAKRVDRRNAFNRVALVLSACVCVCVADGGGGGGTTVVVGFWFVLAHVAHG